MVEKILKSVEKKKKLSGINSSSQGIQLAVVVVKVATILSPIPFTKKTWMF